jgi:anaerobic ribonucleoside-triphosphate reductase activating protein
MSRSTEAQRKLNLARLAWPVTSLGPGNRLALWVAGCRLACAGCISPELRHAAAGKPIDPGLLAEHILSLPQALDGLSISGGEPFDQADRLAALWSLLLAQRPHWNLLIFSGYRYRQLQRMPQTAGLLRDCDLLIAGPYRSDRPGSAALQASANQRRLALTPAGESMLEAMDTLNHRANIGRDVSGRGWLIGIVDPQQRQQLHQQLGLSSRIGNWPREEPLHD